jgi:hypothetical protein
VRGIPDELRGHVDNYVQFIDAWKLDPVLVEAVVVNYTRGYAGTFDLIADLDSPTGERQRLLLDIKTGATGVFSETALQLAAYRNAEYYVDADGDEQPMIAVDGCAAIHVTAANKIYGAKPTALTGAYPADSGGASRFFPTFKYEPKAPTNERPNHDGTAHPTVKPVDLIRWLIRLVTPPSGTVLDPFAGTGTTAEAAIKEHKHAILIEREDMYLPLIVARLSKPMEIGFDFEESA